ncbi:MULTISPECIES: hypothetical protein [Novosphingobium]|uniref:Uncharacterized protein n=1 Tax=Novosphingobium resinovorum TaxID=158500 RepID=A0A031JGA3_9SPHN|nr:hypothetical protein [Novosphingobium resinovorum]EZP72176.1 hypothetical protein BV97_05139 [Novosphingobium resinovorum]GLK43979.1 hypothetical protein GCM10017612_18990 [Novosphingobium resinovorum]
MNGLLSSAPSQPSIRLVLSALLLQFVQTTLLFLSPRLDASDRTLIWALTPLALTLLAVSLAGTARAAAHRRSRRHEL